MNCELLLNTRKLYMMKLQWY